jgi:hypothetical protein
MALQGQRSQLQTGNPAFGAGFQGGNVVSGEGQAHHQSEKLGGFGRGKAQIGGAHFGHLASGTETGERQRWVLAGPQDG